MALIRNAVILLGFVLAFGVKISLAQQTRTTSNYPDRPIRFIVPFPPAGANDILARAVGQRLTGAWGQPVIIDNRPGAGGVTGTAMAAKTAPAGYTIVLVPATHAINVSLYKKPPYDASGAVYANDEIFEDGQSEYSEYKVIGEVTKSISLIK